MTKGNTLDNRELATTLAALRFLQNHPEVVALMPHFYGTGVVPLSSEEIDDLCEKLNYQEVA